MVIGNDTLGYPILVCENAEPSLRTFVRARGMRCVVLADAQPDVAARARALAARLPRCLGVLPIALGEPRKRLATVEAIADALLAAGADRATLAIGVGGGVANDIFGLAAALFMRGVPYAHVATSLLAMLDASIGGKVGVDTPAGKNLVGRFSDPVAVFADLQALRTLPFREIRAGLAEAVKHAILAGGESFDMLEMLAPHRFERWPWGEVVARSVAIKAAVVRADREERGIRATLNLGHTFAHAYESASGYRIAHGAAVALGLRAAGLLALRGGLFTREAHLRVLALLALLGMPLSTRVPADAALAAMRGDKKRRDGSLRFVLPDEIGLVHADVRVPDARVRSVLHAMEAPPGDAEH